MEAGHGSVREVFGAFLKLGLTAFGGPVAHLGYFRDELVLRRRWLGEAAYADLVALCQFLPGPASSQVGFALGCLRGGGLRGGLAAWAAFTLPSVLLLLGFALAASGLSGPVGLGIVHGLKLTAVAIVAAAVLGMARSLAPDGPRAAIAAGALLAVALVPGFPGQLVALIGGAVAGLAIRSGERVSGEGVPASAFPVSRRAGLVALATFGALLVLASLASAGPQAVALAGAFYRAGALVFGCGHVVLPLLRVEVVDPGWVEPDAFLAGYAAAQAVPGPLFSFAAYLGAVAGPSPHGLAGAAIALVAIFLPGLLVVYGSLPFWSGALARPAVRAAMRGVNAAVVGLLAAALYDPVWTGAVGSVLDVAVAGAAFVGLVAWRAPPVLVVGAMVLAGALRGG